MPLTLGLLLSNFVSICMLKDAFPGNVLVLLDSKR